METGWLNCTWHWFVYKYSTVANWKFLKPNIFCLHFGMPFEVNNFAIRTWNVVSVVEGCHVLGIYSFTFRTPLNCGILRSSCYKNVASISESRLYLRKWFVFGRPFLKQFTLCYDHCLSCLSVTLVYCCQTVGWIRMLLGVEAWCGSRPWPRHTVLDGDPPSPMKRGTAAPPPHCAIYGHRPGLHSYKPRVMSVVTKWLDGSGCHLVQR